MIRSPLILESRSLCSSPTELLRLLHLVKLGLLLSAKTCLLLVFPSSPHALFPIHQL
jgi:hypothetical protein